MNKDLATVVTVIVGILAFCLFGTAALLAFKMAGAAWQGFLAAGVGISVAWGAVIYDKYL